MAVALSKRQQARNEQALQELIRSVPGNNQCADCQSRNPGWASWNLGIFICLRCATLHRKLGTHISKVKSISLDAWSNEHVEIMKKTGNVESNRKFNPQNVKPAMPIDVDEVDGVMERYIRQKYEKRQLEDASRPGTRQNTGSTSSVDDRPLPLPPKPSRKFGFGFRSASSPFGLSRSDKRTPTLSPQHTRDTPSPNSSKPSSTLDLHETSDAFAAKLRTLREMGFTDDRRNASVLQSMNGSIERSVDALQRLGNTRSASTGPRRAVSSNNLNGISVVKPKPDPFEALDSTSQPQPQAVQQFVPQPATQPAVNGTNPFLQTQQASYAQPTLEQSFAGISIAQPQPQSQPQQPSLFPHNTGPQPQQPAYQHNPFQQSFTPPPVPTLPPQYKSMVSYSPPPISPPQSASSAFPPGGNPFLRSTQSQYFQSSNNPYNAPNTQSFNTNQQAGWSTQPQPPQQQSWNTGQAQSPNPFLQQQYQRQQSPTASSNPFLQQQQQIYSQPSNPSAQPNYALYNQSTPFQPSYSHEAAAFSPGPSNPYQQPPRRADTSSILALYNLPQSTDTPPMPQRSVTMPVTLPNGGSVPNVSTPSTTTPITTTPSAASLSRANGNSNPFASSLAQAPSQHQPLSQAASQIQAQAPNPAVQGLRQGNPKIGDPSRESVDFVGLMNGRHSPDAFSGLSARFT